jgi:hypothetical protein
VTVRDLAYYVVVHLDLIHDDLSLLGRTAFDETEAITTAKLIATITTSHHEQV